MIWRKYRSRCRCRLGNLVLRQYQRQWRQARQLWRTAAESFDQQQRDQAGEAKAQRRQMRRRLIEARHAPLVAGVVRNTEHAHAAVAPRLRARPLDALIKIFYLLSVFIVLLESYDEKGNFIKEETKQDSLLYEPVKNLSLTTIPRIKESTIFLTNSLKAEQDSTGLSVQDILRAKEIADSLGIDANDAMELKRIHDEYSQK